MSVIQTAFPAVHQHYRQCLLQYIRITDCVYCSTSVIQTPTVKCMCILPSFDQKPVRMYSSVSRTHPRALSQGQTALLSSAPPVLTAKRISQRKRLWTCVLGIFLANVWQGITTARNSRQNCVVSILHKTHSTIRSSKPFPQYTHKNTCDFVCFYTIFIKKFDYFSTQD